jgi:hypothetical protein
VRNSFIICFGSVLIGIAACSDGDPLGVGGTGGSAGSPSVGGAGGTRPSETGGTGGKAGAGSGGTGKGGSGGTGKGGSGGTGKGGSGGTGKGGSGGTGKGGSGGKASAGAGGTSLGGTGGSAGTGVGGTVGDDAGAGGSDDGGAAGSGDAGAGGACSASCGDVCVEPADRALDQKQLDMPGSVGLSVRQRPGQSFTVGTAGLLTGIEVAVGPCNGSDTSGQIRLELFDANRSSLGNVTIEQASLPDVCGGQQLVEGTVGPGYFDLTPLCVSVQAGDALMFMLSVVGNPPASCDDNQCTNSGEFCLGDFECEGFFYVGETNCGGVGCDTGPNDYAGGTSVMQNPSDDTFDVTPGFDLAFKTFQN